MVSGVSDGVADALRPAGFTPNVGRPQGPCRSRAGCHHPSSSTRKWSRPWRRRLVRVRHRVVFGTLEAVQQVLAACGWQINTAFVERINLTIRQHVAAVGRRVSTLCGVKTGCGSNWRSTTPTITSAYHAYLLTPAIAPPRSDARHRHRQTLAAADTRDGGGAD